MQQKMEAQDAYFICEEEREGKEEKSEKKCREY